jgi:transcriptional regulator with XRE-family HTH domain
MSQESLADAVGVSDTYIRKLEAGTRTPSLKVVVELATVLKTTPDHLLLTVSPPDKQDRNVYTDFFELLNDCSTTEFVILYENMSALKELLRTHIKIE